MTVLEEMWRLEALCDAVESRGYHLAEAMALAPAGGYWMEFGVFQGASLRVLAGGTQETVWGFDSFEGIPEEWNGHEVGWLTMEGKAPRFEEENIELVVGRFEKTLEPWLEEHPGLVALLHLDCDVYSSTAFVLRALEDRFAEGTIVCFDELLGFPGYQDHELKAWAECLLRTGRKVVPFAKQTDGYGVVKVAFEVIS